MTPARPGRPLLRAAALALALAGLAGGCSDRPRDNPLDPLNRTTHGMLVGFDALAADGVVELRWPLLTQQGVEGYHVQRWRPGGSPALLPGAAFPSYVGAAEDFDVANDSTYVYRLVALFATGDSAASPPDTATPGSLRVVALTAEPPGLAGLTADARGLFYTIGAKEAYADAALDPVRGWYWLSQHDQGSVERRRFDGTTVGSDIEIGGPDALAVTTGRGAVWIARFEIGDVVSYVPDSAGVTPGNPIRPASGQPVAVEANSANATVWVGTSDGTLVQAAAGTGTAVNTWHLPGGIAAIAADEAADAAWVAVHEGDSLGLLFDLYFVVAGDPSIGPPVRAGLVGVADLLVDPTDRSLWVSERGPAGDGIGRLTRIGGAGQTLAALTGIEPYGLAMEPGSSDCWVADLKSNRLLEVSPGGAVVRRSAALGAPYRVIVYRP